MTPVGVPSRHPGQGMVLYPASETDEADVDLRQMRYFVAIVDEGAFSRAAASLGVAQPALSLHVRKMEEELGTTLLLRSAGGVTPTEAGLHLAARARGLLAEMHSLEEELVRLAPPGAPADKAGLAIFGAAGSWVFSMTPVMACASTSWPPLWAQGRPLRNPCPRRR